MGVPGSRLAVWGLGWDPGFWALGSGSKSLFLSLLRPLLAGHHGCITVGTAGPTQLFRLLRGLAANGQEWEEEQA